MDTPIKLVLADVDGTLVTPDKALTAAAIEAVHGLHDHGILFAVTSGRPPRGMAMLVEPLDLRTPIAAFNGGLLVDRSMQVLAQHVLPSDIVGPVAELLRSHGLDVWLYLGASWFLTDPDGPHVAREAWTVKFSPTVVHDFGDLTDGVVKLVGVGDDTNAIEAAGVGAAEAFGNHVTAAASQPYYLDVTHPMANKGSVARHLAVHYGLDPTEIATIGDMPNDVLMFAHSGLSIAMGNADPQVKRAARRITTGNDDEGFARAMERYVLSGAPRPPGGSRSGRTA